MIRRATKDDNPAILALGRAMHAESRYARFDYDEEKYRRLVEHLIDNGIAIVSAANGQVSGVFLGVVSAHFFGNDLQSTDFIQYVTPEFRGGMTGVRLIREYIRIAKEIGVKDICIGNSSGISTERTGELYKRLGFTHHGCDYSLG